MNLIRHIRRLAGTPAVLSGEGHRGVWGRDWRVAGRPLARRGRHDYPLREQIAQLAPGQAASFRQPRLARRHEEGNRPMYIGVGTLVVIVIIVLVILLLRRSF